MAQNPNAQNGPITYADAGVDINRSNKTKQRIKYLAHKTFTRGVLSEIGGFGGLFSVDKKYLDPVLVSSVDGVGTKLKIAFEMKMHHTIGADLGIGVEYRPPLTENIVLTGGASALQPGRGFKDIYTGRTLFSLFGSVKFTF